MYRNVPSGDGIFGKFIDKILLNLPAVQATRNRKDTIKKILREEVQHNIQCNKETKILDIASGPARYLVELGSELGKGFIALCLDIDEKSLQKGRELAQEYNLTHLIAYRKADISNAEKIDNLDFRPCFIIVSGLYVYQDDEFVKRSLGKLCKLLQPGDKILVDNQINSPSRKLMEKVCKTTQGSAWKLAYRSEEHMKSLMVPYFKDITSFLDKWGMYNIAVGIKY
jgi:ubiquinone/menaquinone biosynthesis C-methylase UbiE